MPRTKYETIRLRWQGLGPETVIEPGVYHLAGKWAAGACQELETDDGCSACQEEMEVVEDEIEKLYKAMGREVVDFMLVNRPEEDGYWEYEVESRKT